MVGLVGWDEVVGELGWMMGTKAYSTRMKFVPGDGTNFMQGL